MIVEYGLRCPGLEARAPAFQEILETIANLGEERAIGNSVASIVRSLLSGMERAEEENRERAKVVQELSQRHPAFFIELGAWVEDTKVWARSCRAFKELRAQAKADIAARIQDPDRVHPLVRACQRAAIRQCAGINPHWAGLLPPTQAESELAARHPDIVAKFRQACDLQPILVPSEDDQFRRFRSEDTLPSKLADESYLLERIIDFYRGHVNPLTEATEQMLKERTKYGRKTDHTGWRNLCRQVVEKKAAPDATALYKFIETQVRVWFRNLRKVQTATWAESPGFWPQLDAAVKWRADRVPNSSNAFEAVLIVLHQGEKTDVKANLRGDLPAGAKFIKEWLEKSQNQNGPNSRLKAMLSAATARPAEGDEPEEPTDEWQGLHNS